MVQKRSRKNRNYTRVQRLKKRRRKILGVILSLSLVLMMVAGGFIIRTKYISYKCQNLTYAIDYYFTNYKDKDLRINRVQTMTFIDKNDTTVKVEAFGLSYKQPHQRTTLVGELNKNDNGSWVMNSLEKKETP